MGMKRWDVINWLIRAHGYSCYLEIGLSDGKNFGRVQCKQKESVDPAQDRYDHAKPSYKMTSDAFFETVAATQRKTYDLVFIDGLHEADQVDRDIVGALACLAPGGTVMLHDCNPQDEARQRVPRIQRAWNGDVWKSAVRFRARQDVYGCIVVDADEGLGIIREDIHSDFRLTLPETLTWPWLEMNRVQALGLISKKKFLARYLPDHTA